MNEQKQNPQVAALSQMVFEGMQREVALRAQLITANEMIERLTPKQEGMDAETSRPNGKAPKTSDRVAAP